MPSHSIEHWVYTYQVKVLIQGDDRQTLRYLFGSVLCCLLLLFAVSAKIAPYHTQRAAKPIAATKAWQNNAIPSADTEPAAPTLSLLDIFTVILSLLFAAVSTVSVSRPIIPAPCWFSPYLSVRPPPAA